MGSVARVRRAGVLVNCPWRAGGEGARSPAAAQAGLRAGCVAVLSMPPDLAPGHAVVEDLGDLAERLWGFPLV